jgi:CheY-like chemotaxis protein
MKMISIPRDFNVLVVEDDQRRIRWFSDKLRSINHRTFAYTPAAALKALNESDVKFDLVFLDHDAGIEDDDGTLLDFLPVAKRLRALDFTGPVIVHSMSDPGWRRIKSFLPESVRAVFGTFDLEVV